MKRLIAKAFKLRRTKVLGLAVGRADARILKHACDLANIGLTVVGLAIIWLREIVWLAITRLALGKIVGAETSGWHACVLAKRRVHWLVETGIVAWLAKTGRRHATWLAKRACGHHSPRLLAKTGCRHHTSSLLTETSGGHHSSSLLAEASSGHHTTSLLTKRSRHVSSRLLAKGCRGHASGLLTKTCWRHALTKASLRRLGHESSCDLLSER